MDINDKIIIPVLKGYFRKAPVFKPEEVKTVTSSVKHRIRRLSGSISSGGATLSRYFILNGQMLIYYEHDGSGSKAFGDSKGHHNVEYCQVRKLDPSEAAGEHFAFKITLAAHEHNKEILIFADCEDARTNFMRILEFASDKIQWNCKRQYQTSVIITPLNKIWFGHCLTVNFVTIHNDFLI